jgi:transposase
MVEERFVLTDEVWVRLAPQLPGKQGDAGATGKDNRLFLEAVLWRVRTGSPWRDLPADFGNWNSVACSDGFADGLRAAYSSEFSRKSVGPQISNTQ